ncbi:TPA: tRNA pseudouridine(13) synthase TruD, partial [Candidatus Bathyarchaeota archaeon]|nr:tRNA pseudouridine(13) synthase TruD [Candidatus Bathyarchaeota archaeon]
YYLCHPSPSESPNARKARVELLETLNFKRALKNFPASLVYERRMISYLVSHPKDYVGALKRLPSRLRLLFVNAYQAFLFNEILSERILSHYPLNEALEGDWVLKLKEPGLAASPFKASANKLEEINDGIKGGRLALALPVVGYRTTLSGGAQGALERSILEREGVAQRDFYIGPMPEASSAGNFRTALAPVKDVEFKLNDRSATFKFFLLKGSYATAFLREIMKPKDPVKAGF